MTAILSNQTTNQNSMLSFSTEEHLDALFDYLTEKKQSIAGYPCSTDFDYRELYRFLEFPLNNVGDPFQQSTYQVSTHLIEQEVIHFFADLFNAPKDNYWGYVSNGGTEGNLYGLYLARELYPKGIVYFSEDTHYSVNKNVHFLNMRHIMLRSTHSGEIDYDDLYESLKIHRDVPAIIFANIGTTMKEGKDNIPKIVGMLDDLCMHDRYIHADAALCGLFAPFIEDLQFDFSVGVDSIAMSGHKFIGSPIPCGIVLAKKNLVQRIARSIGYIGSLDTTITGSRNGFTPLLLWYAIQKLGLDGFKKRYTDARKLADYAYETMQAKGLTVWRNQGALTLFFPEVKQWIQQKWQIATQGVSHLIVMPGVTKEKIDAIILDISKSS